MKKLFVAVVFAGWLVFFAVSILEMLPSTTARIDNKRGWVSFFLPQGWSFFTKNPKDEALYLYLFRDGKWIEANLGPKSSPRNLFGWWRAPRAQLMEVNNLLAELDQKAITECPAGKKATHCLSEIENKQKIVNHFERPSLCGLSALVFRKPVPWAWARMQKPVEMSSRILVVDAECESPHRHM